MASITSLMNSSSSTSSIYGNRNIISGLASGMDTESMIENSISGYKTKISNLQKQMTKMQWKQDAYRSLITQMNNILSKYTSYTSSTNLFSSSFFTKAVNTVANGANAAAVSATGKSSSNVAIDRIKQLAQAASYTVGTSDLVSNGSATEAIEWDKMVETNNVSGSISIKYGGGTTGKGSTFTLRFAEGEVYNTPDELAKAINEKLADNNISAGGSTKSADNYIKASVQDGKVVLEDQKGNYFSITSVSGGMANLFEKGEATTIDGGNRGFTSKAIATYDENGTKLTDGVDLVDKSKSTAAYLEGKSISVTLDGKTKTIKMDDILADADVKAALAGTDNDAKNAAFAKALNSKLNTEFSGKVKVDIDDNGGLKFTGPTGNGSVLKVTGSSDIVNKALGLGEGGYSTTLQTSWSLEKVLGKDNAIWKDDTDENGNAIKTAEITMNGKSFTFKSTDTINDLMTKINGDEDAGVEIKYSSLTGNFAITAKETGVDSKIDIGGDLGVALFGVSKKVDETTTFNEAFGAGLQPGESKNIRFNFLFPNTAPNSLMFSINDTTTVDDVMDEVTEYLSEKGDNYEFSIDKETFEIKLRHKPTGLEAKTEIIGPDSTKLKLKEEYSSSKGTYTAGQDAVFTATINGEEMEFTRSSNTVNLDGMSVTLKNSFGYNEDGSIDKTAEKITFTTSTDSDKIVDAVKSFVEDYNKLVTELHNAYTTESLKNSSGKAYEPLTDDDMSGMSESSIKAYEDKAKTGILFGDQDLSNLYSRLTEAVQGTGQVGAALRSIGLTVEFSNGLSTVKLDEDALRSALDSDPDKVKNAFTQSTSTGASVNGLMAGLKNTLEMYGNTSIGSPGILVNKAGTELSSYSLNNNELQDQMESLQDQIEKWQDKMSDRVDYYTNKFTALEMLINQMNSQSSMLAGLMGG